MRHQRMQSMLAAGGELTFSDQVLLSRHLESCGDCRRLADLLAENRLRLRSLAQTRPPAELRSAVVSAAEGSQEALASWAPVALAFLIVPATLIAIAVMIIFGAPGVLAVAAALLLFCAVTARHISRIESAAESLANPEPWRPLADLKWLGIDLLGVTAGGLILGLVLWVVTLVAPH